MKRIIITRHGKAEEHRSGMTDFERKLAKRGIKEAPLVAEREKNHGIKPEVFISSPANRAYQTAIKFAEVFNYPVDKIVVRDFLYGYYSFDKILYLIEEVAFEAQTVMLFGHNPTLEELAYSLSKQFNEFIPTSGSVGIEFNVESWNEIRERSGKVIFFEYPKKH